MEAVMHYAVLSRNRCRRSCRAHGADGSTVSDALDPAKTALVVVDMQNAFMLPGVAHALCPMAEKIVAQHQSAGSGGAPDRRHRHLDQDHVQS
jgi:hypothetical protein